MPLFSLKLPPGMSRPGTKYDAKGRWYDGTLVRWYEGIMQAVGGWQKIAESGADLNLTGVPRGAHAWRDNSDEPHLALGTHTKLYAWVSGALTDVTPAGFSATGGADAVQTSGVYGSGNYGDGPYGLGGSAATTLVEANTWQMDNHGQDLVAVAFDDGKIYTQTGAAQAAVLTNAPTDVRGVVVTPEHFLVALGDSPNDTGNRRVVSWPDVDDRTVWGATASNQAGELPLPGAGEILAGRRARNETLIWTDVDLFAMRYIGGEFVYQIPQVGSNCGAISRRSMAVIDGQAIWMGNNSFFTYNGFVKPLPSEVGDYVFGDMNKLQRSKIWAETRSSYGEVTWHYPSASSTECDRYVTFNYREGIWYFGMKERTAGVDRGVWTSPMSTDSTGAVYEEEIEGATYLDTDDATALVPFAESGPVEIGEGDNVMSISQIIPDETTLGDVDLSIFAALYPTATETEYGPFTAAEPTDVRVLGRQIRIKVVQDQTGWRFGTPRLDVRQGGRR
jgi:hypothetical protein